MSLLVNIRRRKITFEMTMLAMQEAQFLAAEQFILPIPKLARTIPFHDFLPSNLQVPALKQCRAALLALYDCFNDYSSKSLYRVHLHVLGDSNAGKTVLVRWLVQTLRERGMPSRTSNGTNGASIAAWQGVVADVVDIKHGRTRGVETTSVRLFDGTRHAVLCIHDYGGQSAFLSHYPNTIASTSEHSVFILVMSMVRIVPKEVVENDPEYTYGQVPQDDEEGLGSSSASTKGKGLGESHVTKSFSASADSSDLPNSLSPTAKGLQSRSMSGIEVETGGNGKSIGGRRTSSFLSSSAGGGGTGSVKYTDTAPGLGSGQVKVKKPREVYYQCRTIQDVRERYRFWLRFIYSIVRKDQTNRVIPTSSPPTPPQQGMSNYTTPPSVSITPGGFVAPMLSHSHSVSQQSLHTVIPPVPPSTKQLSLASYHSKHRQLTSPFNPRIPLITILNKFQNFLPKSDDRGRSGEAKRMIGEIKEAMKQELLETYTVLGDQVLSNVMPSPPATSAAAAYTASHSVSHVSLSSLPQSSTPPSTSSSSNIDFIVCPNPILAINCEYAKECLQVNAGLFHLLGQMEEMKEKAKEIHDKEQAWLNDREKQREKEREGSQGSQKKDKVVDGERDSDIMNDEPIGGIEESIPLCAIMRYLTTELETNPAIPLLLTLHGWKRWLYETIYRFAILREGAADKLAKATLNGVPSEKGTSTTAAAGDRSSVGNRGSRTSKMRDSRRESKRDSRRDSQRDSKRDSTGSNGGSSPRLSMRSPFGTTGWSTAAGNGDGGAVVYDRLSWVSDTLTEVQTRAIVSLIAHYCEKQLAKYRYIQRIDHYPINGGKVGGKKLLSFLGSTSSDKTEDDSNNTDNIGATGSREYRIVTKPSVLRNTVIGDLLWWFGRRQTKNKPLSNQDLILSKARIIGILTKAESGGGGSVKVNVTRSLLCGSSNWLVLSCMPCLGLTDARREVILSSSITSESDGIVDKKKLKKAKKQGKSEMLLNKSGLVWLKESESSMFNNTENDDNNTSFLLATGTSTILPTFPLVELLNSLHVTVRLSTNTTSIRAALSSGLHSDSESSNSSSETVTNGTNTTTATTTTATTIAKHKIPSMVASNGPVCWLLSLAPFFPHEKRVLTFDTKPFVKVNTFFRLLDIDRMTLIPGYFLNIFTHLINDLSYNISEGYQNAIKINKIFDLMFYDDEVYCDASVEEGESGMSAEGGGVGYGGGEGGGKDLGGLTPRGGRVLAEREIVLTMIICESSDGDGFVVSVGASPKVDSSGNDSGNIDKAFKNEMEKTIQMELDSLRLFLHKDCWGVVLYESDY